MSDIEKREDLKRQKENAIRELLAILDLYNVPDVYVVRLVELSAHIVASEMADGLARHFAESRQSVAQEHGQEEI